VDLKYGLISVDDHVLTEVSTEDRRKLLYENALQVYGINAMVNVVAHQ